MVIPNITSRTYLPNPTNNSGVIYYISTEDIYMRSDGISWLIITKESITQYVDTGIEQPLTDAELRATPVPVSGIVTAEVDTTGLATSDNQTNGDQLTKITDGAGVVNTKQLGTALNTSDIGLVTNSIIHGLSSSGGGTIVDVKVNPSGSLQVALGDITGVDGQQTMTNSLPVAIASDQSAVPISASSLPLPMEAATSTNQTTINTSVRYLLDRNNGTFDAFYRMRFTQPETIFDSKQIADKQILYWDDQLVSGSGGASTYNTNQASTTLTVANLTAGKRVRQTFRWFNYQPGKSHLIIMTGIWGSANTGIKRKAGLFQDNNGVFFDQQSDGMGVTIRTYTSGSAVDTRILQANWNIDKLDGTGASGIALDFTKTLIWFIDFEWLGVGTIRYGFFVGGRPYYCHEIHNSNINTLVYMSNPNLPLRYEIENTGTGEAVGFTHICSTVISEGGHQTTGSPRGFNRGSASLITLNNTNLFPLAAMRLNTNYKFTDITDLKFSFVCTSTAAFAWYLILNPTVTGTAFSYTQLTNSGVEMDLTTTNATTVSAGTILASGVTQQQNEASAQLAIAGDIRLGTNIAGTSDVLVIAVQRLTGTTETFYCAGTFNETN